MSLYNQSNFRMLSPLETFQRLATNVWRKNPTLLKLICAVYKQDYQSLVKGVKTPPSHDFTAIMNEYRVFRKENKITPQELKAIFVGITVKCKNRGIKNCKTEEELCDVVAPEIMDLLGYCYEIGEDSWPTVLFLGTKLVDFLDKQGFSDKNNSKTCISTETEEKPNLSAEEVLDIITDTINTNNKIPEMTENEAQIIYYGLFSWSFEH